MRTRKVKTEVFQGIESREAMHEFIIHCKAKRLAEATIKGYRGYLTPFISWYGEEVSIGALKNSKIDEYIVLLQERGMKDISVSTAMRHIRTFINFCKKREYVDKNVEVIVPKVDVEYKEPYSDAEMRKLLKRPRGNNWVEWRTWAMINYFFATGQRLSTVVNIKVSDVNLDNRTVFLRHNKDKIQKNMPLSAALVKVLEEWLYMADIDADGYLFPNMEGNKLSSSNCEDRIAEYNRARGVEKRSVHLFRHTFAKNFIVNGGNPLVLQKLLNHKTIDMTMRYVNLYSHDISKELDLYDPLAKLKGRRA